MLIYIYFSIIKAFLHYLIYNSTDRLKNFERIIGIRIRNEHSILNEIFIIVKESYSYMDLQLMNFIEYINASFTTP